MELGLICGIVLAALTLSLVLKKDAPAIAFLLVLTAGVILLLRVFSAAGSAAQRFFGLLSQCGLDSALYLPVCKAVGVAVVVRITAALCRDAGQSALAAKMEIAGAVLTLSVCLIPHFFSRLLSAAFHCLDKNILTLYLCYRR